MTREYSLRLIKMEERHVGGLTGHANEEILLERTCNIMATDMEFIGYINAYIRPFRRIVEIEMVLAILLYHIR